MVNYLITITASLNLQLVLNQLTLLYNTAECDVPLRQSHADQHQNFFRSLTCLLISFESHRYFSRLVHMDRRPYYPTFPLINLSFISHPFGLKIKATINANKMAAVIPAAVKSNIPIPIPIKPNCSDFSMAP